MIKLAPFGWWPGLWSLPLRVALAGFGLMLALPLLALALGGTVQAPPPALLAVVLAGAVLGPALLAWLVVRWLRPLDGLLRWVAVSAGDETAPPPPHRDRADRFGELARALDSLREAARLRALQAEERAARDAERLARTEAMDTAMEQFGVNVGQVMQGFEQSASEMLSASSRLSAAMSATGERIAGTAAEAAVSSEELQAVAAALDQMAAGVSGINAQVSEAASVARAAVADAQRSDARMQALTQSAERVGSILGVIGEVAGRTNLLALNATIEAARAGEAGRGFAVVAGEVKNLASQTSRATEEVAGQIQAMRAATGEAARAMQAIAAAIGRIDEVTAAIAGAMEEQRCSAAEVTQRLQGVARATASVTEAMGEVAGMTEEAAGITVEVECSAATVQGESGMLKAEVESFLMDLRAAAEERRRAERRSAGGRRAVLRANGAEETLEVIDISATGLGLRRDAPLPESLLVTVALEGAAAPSQARVVRWQDGVLGIAFAEADRQAA